YPSCRTTFHTTGSIHNVNKFSINYTTNRLNLPFFHLILQPPPRSTLFPYTTLFRSKHFHHHLLCLECGKIEEINEDLLGDVEARSEEHTSELQSRFDLVCRLLLEKKKFIRPNIVKTTT